LSQFPATDTHVGTDLATTAAPPPPPSAATATASSAATPSAAAIIAVSASFAASFTDALAAPWEFTAFEQFASESQCLLQLQRGDEPPPAAAASAPATPSSGILAESHADHSEYTLDYLQ